MIAKPPSPSGASVSGVMIPCCLTDSTSSAICSSSNSRARVEAVARLDLRQRNHAQRRGHRPRPSFGQQCERSVLERLRLGRALEARLGVRAAGRLPRRLDVIDVRRDRLQRAPARAADVRRGRAPPGRRCGSPRARARRCARRARRPCGRAAARAAARAARGSARTRPRPSARGSAARRAPPTRRSSARRSRACAARPRASPRRCAVWRAFHVRCAPVERKQHPVQAGEPERRDARP